MYKILGVLISFLFIFACREEEIPMEIFSPEAYAYQLDSGWELNVSVQVKGLEYKVQNEEYLYSVSYSADIITTANDTLKQVSSGKLDETGLEELPDIPVEIQVELDSTFTPGKYQIIINVSDNFANKMSVLQSYFELTND